MMSPTMYKLLYTNYLHGLTLTNLISTFKKQLSELDDKIIMPIFSEVAFSCEVDYMLQIILKITVILIYF